MEKLLFAAALFSTSLCAKDIPKKKNKAIMQADKVIKITPQGSHEGNPVYFVKLQSGRTFEYMYIEEIKECQRTGTWKYNEMLTLKKSN